MTFRELQDRTAEWIGRYEDGYWPPLAQVTCLAEEVGELAREVNHLHGPKRKKASEEKSSIGMEIADCVMILCCLANSLDIDLDESWRAMWRKIESRDKDRFPKKL